MDEIGGSAVFRPCSRSAEAFMQESFMTWDTCESNLRLPIRLEIDCVNKLSYDLGRFFSYSLFVVYGLHHKAGPGVRGKRTS